MNKSFRQCYALLLFVAFLLQTATSSAAIIESAGFGNWGSNSTWAGGIIPDAGDDVIIKNGHTVTLSDSRSCSAVTVESGAIFVLTGTLNNSNTFLNHGTVNWDGNFGSGAVVNTGTLNATGYVARNTDADITNNSGGVINWTDGWFDYGAGGQTLTNHGVFNLIGNNPANFTCKMAIVNSGTINKITGTLSIIQTFENQAGGTISVSSGATLTLNTGMTQSGTFAVNGTVALNGGSYTFDNNFTGSGTLNITNPSTVTIASGFAPELPTVNQTSTLNAGAGTALTIHSGTTWNWQGDFGAFSSITNNGTLNASGFVNHNTDADMTNNAGGTITWTDGWFDQGAGGQTLTNQGVFNLIGNNPANFTCKMAIVNSGTINKTTGTISIVQAFENQASGVVSVSLGATLTLNTGVTQTGTFTVNGTVVLNGGSHTFNSNFTGSGTLNINNSSTVTAPSGFAPALPIVNHNSTYTLNAGTATALTILSGTVWNWQGNFGAFSSITNNGTLNASGFVTHNTDADITNNVGGTITWTDGWFDHGAGGQTLTNHGVFNLIGNNPANFTCKMDIVNTGTVDKTVGTLSIVQPFDNQSTGSINGQGTLTFTNILTNDGLIAPGLSPGIITLNRTDGLPVNDLAIEIASDAGPGAGHDQLKSVNAININGDLTVTLLNGFTPSYGTVYTIMTYASRTGTFASVTPDCWTVTYGATSTTITYEPDTWYADTDGDGYGDAAVSQLACDQPSGYVSNDDDCDDNNAAINPSATEVCNGIDDDCDGLVDDNDPNVTGQQTWYADTDGDGFGDANDSQLACDQPSGYVSNDDDCDDNNAAINPSATEVCNGIDDDCDDLVDDNDPNVSGQQTWYADTDGDSYGDAAVSQLACDQPSGYVSNDDDCDDNNAAINPSATEVCNGIDDDCDGLVDDNDPNVTGQQTWYADTDGDSYGDAAVSQLACNQPPGYVSNDGDCNDNNAAINPGALEICNGIDDDCDGLEDEGVQSTFYADTDWDGFGDPNVTMLSCGPDEGYVSDNTDCDDTNPNIHSGAQEVCNGLDDDCDGLVDEGVESIFYADADGDGYGDVNTTTLACSAPSGYVNDANDCNDNNDQIHPNAPEVCNNLDDDCDGLVDEGDVCDGDGDGYTVAEGDCNDANANIHPDAIEICNDLDDDCDGLVDENVGTTWYADADGDGYGDINVSQTACSQPSGYVNDANDCNDNNAQVYPGATEVCNDLDDDCDGLVDETNLNLSLSAGNIACNGGSTNLVASGSGGVPPYQYSLDNGAFGTSNSFSVSVGSHYVTIKDANNCLVSNTIVVNEPEALLIDPIEITHVACGGGNTGAVNITVSGGTGSYTYRWSNTRTTQDLMNVGANTYTVTVTDANACTATASATVNPRLSLTLTKTNVVCNGASDGTATATATGGTPAYSYQWSNAETTETIIGLSVGIYTCTVTDDKGCTRTKSIYVGQPSAIGISGVVTKVTCNGASNGQIAVNINHGVAPFSYAWSDGASTEDRSNLAAGSYTLSVTDSNGCTREKSFNVTQPTALALTFNVANVSCNGDADGEITAIVTGGVKYPNTNLCKGERYCFNWSHGDTARTTSGLIAGIYTVSVTDANGCSITGFATVTEPTLLEITEVVVAPLPNGKYNLAVTAEGGTPNYKYRRIPGGNYQNSNVFNNVPAGTYDVVVLDKHFCTDTTTVVVGNAGRPENPDERKGSENLLVIDLDNPVTAYPNPASERFQLQVEREYLQANVMIFNAQGQLMEVANFEDNSDLGSYEVNTWNSGLYLIVVYLDGERFVQKVMVASK